VHSKSYLVIGSNSFTGSHIVDALLDNPQNCVVGVSRSPEYKDIFLPYKRHSLDRYRFHPIDLTKQFDELTKLIEAVKPQVIINVAALSEVGLSNERPVEYFETNTLTVVKLCNYLRQQTYLERYVHISSAEIFGSCEKPVHEEALFNPNTPYAVSKAAADMYLNVLIKNFNFPALLIRTTNVYGRHQQLFKIIPRTIIYLKLGKKIQIQGGGKAIKSFIHIRDAVRGMLLAIDYGQSGTYHFSMDSDQTVADVIALICRRMGYDFKTSTVVSDDRVGQDNRYWLDCSKAERELKWKPLVSFEQGVSEVMAWIEGNWSAIQKEPLTYIHKVGAGP